MSKFRLSIIACVDMAGGIGREGQMPWKCPADMKWFSSKTRSQQNSTSIVIMGRKTFQSIGKRLPDRVNIVVSSKDDITGHDVIFVKSFDAAVDTAIRMTNDVIDTDKPVGNTFVIGGSSLYEAAMKSPYLHKILIGFISFSSSQQCKGLPDVSNSSFVASQQCKEPDFNCDVFMFGDVENTHRILQSLFIEYQQTYEHHQEAEISYVNAEGIQINTVCILTHHEFMRQNNTAEMKYLSLLSKIMRAGNLQPNRTGISTLSLFSKKLKFPLMIDGIIGKKLLPLITTKRVPYITVCNELIWFIRGEANTKFLKEKGVRIWEGNTSRAYLDSKGLTDYEEGQTGPIYGVQWRHWRTTNGEIDQLVDLIHNIMVDPYSRRHVLTAWNVADIDKMCLPPCHMTSVWKVDAEGGRPKYLSCHILMRSADMFLGVPFNIASYATLTHLIAEICGLTAKTLAVDMIDCHIYENHLNQCKEQLGRDAICFPSLDFSENIITVLNEFNNTDTIPSKNPSENKSRIKWLLNVIGNKINGRDFIPKDYVSWNAIQAPMAV